MIIKSKVLNLDKLETLLISKWNDFLDNRKLLNFVKGISVNHHGNNCRVQNVKLSRFKPQHNGFLIWIEFSISITSNLTDCPKIINMTTEAFLELSGDLIHIKSI